MISVIIPALNESDRIADVIALALASADVSEVIVVDDGSIDGTPELATAAGARVITSTFLGKGASMEDGLRCAQSEFVVYLDGDLAGLAPGIIERLTEPLIQDKADFVKARFARDSGRVTTLTARPLIKTFFAELDHFEQPLGGIIAARSSLLRTLRFENDYGVDIGLLIDAWSAGARLVEVNIGRLNHASKPLAVLGDMATQVSRAIISRAAALNRLNPQYMAEVSEIERQMQAELSVVFDRVGAASNLALFDMDGVLLDGRYIELLARQIGPAARKKLARFLDNTRIDAESRTREIARIFSGVPMETFKEIARKAPLVEGAAEAVVGLRRAGYRVGIITDSYFVAAETIARRVFADFSIANVMKFKGGIATGNITLCPAMYHPKGCRKHRYCKVNALHHFVDRGPCRFENVIAVGDGDNDICLLETAGQSVAFHPKSRAVVKAARFRTEGPLTDILRIIDNRFQQEGRIARFLRHCFG